MPRKLADELKDCGCQADSDVFRELVRELHSVMHPAWTDEELLYHPDDAKAFCGVVRRRAGSPGLPDDLILRTLVNRRKRNGVTKN